MDKPTELGAALADLKEQEVYALVKEKLASGASAMDIIRECNAAMVEIGNRFEANQYFISELIMSGEIFKNIMAQLEPQMGEAVSGKGDKGVVVMGTVKGDVHDIGKNIAVSLLKGAGYDVVDLGVDVPPDVFVKAAKESNAKVLGLSALLNLAFPALKAVVDEIAKAGIREQVTIMIGGAPCNEEVKQYAGADFYAKDAGAGVKICDDVYGIN